MPYENTLTTAFFLSIFHDGCFLLDALKVIFVAKKFLRANIFQNVLVSVKIKQQAFLSAKTNPKKVLIPLDS